MNWTEGNNDNTASQKQNDWRDEVEYPCRPFVKWVGGKAQLLPEILRRMPARGSIAVYHEPFVGGGAVFFALQPARSVLSDINSELINTFHVVRDNLEILIRDLREHEHSAEYFYNIRGADRSPAFQQWTPVQRASRLIYLNKTCYNGLFRVNSKGHFNTPFGRYTNPNYVDVENLTACSGALKKAEVLLASFDSVVDRARSGDFVYFDPPYAPLSKTAYFTDYDKDGFGDDMQQKLFEVCCALDEKKTRFMLSNSAVPYIKDLYSRFNLEIVHAGRAINSRAEKRGKVEEVLVRNYR